MNFSWTWERYLVQHRSNTFSSFPSKNINNNNNEKKSFHWFQAKKLAIKFIAFDTGVMYARFFSLVIAVHSLLLLTFTAIVKCIALILVPQERKKERKKTQLSKNFQLPSIRSTNHPNIFIPFSTLIPSPPSQKIHHHYSRNIRKRSVRDQRLPVTRPSKFGDGTRLRRVN